MSGMPPETAPKAAVAASPSAPSNPDERWTSSQSVTAACLLVIAAGTMVGAFLVLPGEVLATLVGSVISLTLGPVGQFYFGSSRGSQSKDAALVAQATRPTPPTPPPTPQQ